jgi:hypothetical protein
MLKTKKWGTRPELVPCFYPIPGNPLRVYTPNKKLLELCKSYIRNITHIFFKARKLELKTLLFLVSFVYHFKRYSLEGYR